ncbi:GntR family transcriptional regulator [Croceibacterium xixiisoli]|uniref:GntR family transcriptional regulator n=1 Tax=Croceibacterium xixiisoli TaxID=1476466 RepID=UPI00192856BF|nr:GntR family transcriptional regulator [Croceibacterium xixiisoli]
MKSAAGERNVHGAVDLASLLKLDFVGNEPLYVQITRHLQSLIQSGELPEGSTLPSERRLAEMVGVSRITAQHSYNELRRRGVISSHGRRGSIVRRPENRILSPMNQLRGFTQEMVELGKTPSSRVVKREVTRNHQVATIFGLPSTTPLLYLERIRYADDVPLSNEKAWYNLSVAPELAEAEVTGSVYEQLARLGHPLSYCDQVIDAILPGNDDCAIFGIDPSAPCILIKRQSFSHAEQMLEYVEGTFRGDVYSYRMTLQV